MTYHTAFVEGTVLNTQWKAFVKHTKNFGDIINDIPRILPVVAFITIVAVWFATVFINSIIVQLSACFKQTVYRFLDSYELLTI